MHTPVLKTATVTRQALAPEIRRNGKATLPHLQILSRLKMPQATEKPSPKLDVFIDKTVEQLSKPRAIYVQTALTVVYMAANIVTFGRMTHFDPYPFLFLNFIYSLASGYATVFVLNSNRRQDAEARQRQEAILAAMTKLLEDNKAQSKVLKHFMTKEGLNNESH